MQYFVEKFSKNQSDLTIINGDAHHIINVKRIKIGDEIKVFNGQGLQATAIVEVVHKREVLIKIKEIILSKPLKVEVILNFVPPKGKNLSLLIEKSVEVGVDKIVPMTSERSVRFYQESKAEKLNKIILEACKQSERPWLPELCPMVDFIKRINEVGGSSDCLNLILHPRDGKPIAAQTSTIDCLSKVHLFIGPEGGWSEFEIGLAEEKGLNLTTMNCPVMRVETAVIASLSVIRSIYA